MKKKSITHIRFRYSSDNVDRYGTGADRRL